MGKTISKKLCHKQKLCSGFDRVEPCIIHDQNKSISLKLEKPFPFKGLHLALDIELGPTLLMIDAIHTMNEDHDFAGSNIQLSLSWLILLYLS